MIPHEYFTIVKNHFKGDNKKAWEWFQEVHYNFGMLSPLNAMKLGKAHKVKEYIDKHMR